MDIISRFSSFVKHNIYIFLKSVSRGTHCIFEKQKKPFHVERQKKKNSSNIFLRNKHVRSAVFYLTSSEPFHVKRYIRVYFGGEKNLNPYCCQWVF